MSNGDQFCIEPTAPSGGGGAPSAHAGSHKAGGSDPLLAAPGPIGGGTADTMRGTTITATTTITERGATRLDDQTSDASMEQRKKEGYF